MLVCVCAVIVAAAVKSAKQKKEELHKRNGREVAEPVARKDN